RQVSYEGELRPSLRSEHPPGLHTSPRAHGAPQKPAWVHIPPISPGREGRRGQRAAEQAGEAEGGARGSARRRVNKGVSPPPTAPRPIASRLLPPCGRGREALSHGEAAGPAPSPATLPASPTAARAPAAVPRLSQATLPPPSQQQSTFFLAFNMASSKKVTLSVLSREQSEGVGARVRRSIGRPELKNLDPFLLFDEFKGGRPGGFPDHPHRGFETKTQTNRKVERRYQNAPALPPSGDDHCSRFGVCLSRHLHAYPNMTAYNFI
uniref:Uncharacterized protein n=2 Tax=Equus asinus TaxID=9793 RepID=A0A9L0IXB4_EQUAS